MKPRRNTGRGGRKVKDLKGKKLSVTQQTAVRGGITDGTSNTLMIGERPPGRFLLDAVSVQL